VTLISFYNNKINRKGLNSNQKLHKVKTINQLDEKATENQIYIPTPQTKVPSTQNVMVASQHDTTHLEIDPI
jgi:Mor family transcriptional regulator